MKHYKVKKLRRRNKVALIIHNAYGSNWSTWRVNKQLAKALRFDADLARLILKKNIRELRRLVLKKYGKNIIYSPQDLEFYSELKVVWLEKGEKYTIKEVDGLEYILTVKNLDERA